MTIAELLAERVRVRQAMFDRARSQPRGVVSAEDVDDAELALIDAQLELARENEKRRPHAQRPAGSQEPEP